MGGVVFWFYSVNGGILVFGALALAGLDCSLAVLEFSVVTT